MEHNHKAAAALGAQQAQRYIAVCEINAPSRKMLIQIDV
jgi:hypothetical protein